MDANLALVNAPDHIKALIGMLLAQLGPRLDGLDASLKQVCSVVNNPAASGRIQLREDGSMTTTTSDVCRSYASQIQQLIREQCGGMQRDECDLNMLDEAANASAFPLIKKHINRQEMSFIPTGAAGTGLNAEGLATLFKASGNIAPGQSMLFQQDPNFPLHWRLGCLEAEFTWTGGDDKANWKHIRVTIWVAPRGSTFNTNPASPIGVFGERWNEWHKITGKDLFCDDCSKAVAIQGPTGCPGIDPVGREARILIQVDNLATAPESITGSTLTVEFAGFVKPCCDTCAVNGKTACSCAH